MCVLGGWWWCVCVHTQVLAFLREVLEVVPKPGASPPTPPSFPISLSAPLAQSWYLRSQTGRKEQRSTLERNPYGSWSCCVENLCLYVRNWFPGWGGVCVTCTGTLSPSLSVCPEGRLGEPVGTQGVRARMGPCLCPAWVYLQDKDSVE